MYRHMPTCLERPIPRNRLLGLFDAPVEQVRQELVERVRREIADGVYETPEKWQAALDRLAQRLK